MPSIDIIIPHVDGSVPGYEALARQFTGEFAPCQLRDLGELRFVLRSIEKYANWANVILVVQSEGHVPAWLNRQSVRIVQHHEFIPEELLPTFHWATIAAHLHRIPGLSEQYVYWEDDVLAGAPLHPGDLFGPDGLLSLNWGTIPIPLGLGRFLGMYQLNLEETRRALCRMLDRRVDAFIYPHAPLPATRRSWHDFYEAAIGDPSFRSTVTRRSRGDERAMPAVDPIVLYANWVEAGLRSRANGARRFRAIGRLAARLVPLAALGVGKEMQCGKYAVVNGDARMRRHMDQLRQASSRSLKGNKAVFYNVNDEAYDAWSYDARESDTSALNPASVRLLSETLASLFYSRSRHELEEDRRGAAIADVAPPEGLPADDGNLLLHPGARTSSLSTPHPDLEVYWRWGVLPAPAMAMTIHCWPEVPAGMQVLASWERRGNRPVLSLKMRGELPDHPGAVVCVRFRGRPSRDLDRRNTMKASFRADLKSLGTLKNSVLAMGMGGDYFAEWPVRDDRREADHQCIADLPNWDFRDGEMFLEFRLAVAGLERTGGGVHIEFSDFYLGHAPAPSRRSLPPEAAA